VFLAPRSVTGGWVLASVGVFFPRCPFDRASDTPVASPSCRPLSCTFAHALHAVSLSAFGNEEEALRVDRIGEEGAKAAVTITP
jgi:hypothetical protein